VTGVWEARYWREYPVRQPGCRRSGQVLVTAAVPCPVAPDHAYDPADCRPEATGHGAGDHSFRSEALCALFTKQGKFLQGRRGVFTRYQATGGPYHPPFTDTPVVAAVFISAGCDSRHEPRLPGRRPCQPVTKIFLNHRLPHPRT